MLLTLLLSTALHLVFQLHRKKHRVETAAAANSIGAPAINGAGACANVLQEATVLVTHDGAGRITQIAFDVITTTLSADADGSAALDQTYNVRFVRADVTGPTRKKSGNPGYQVGLPILAGVVQSSGTKQAIQMFVDGLPVPGADASGACSVADPAAAGFLEDTSRTCLINMNLAQLRVGTLGWFRFLYLFF